MTAVKAEYVAPDLMRLIDELTAAEQAGKNLPKETRALLARAARTLNECRELMSVATSELGEAASLRAGLRDSESRVQEVQRMKDHAMRSQVQRMTQLLQRYTEEI